MKKMVLLMIMIFVAFFFFFHKEALPPIKVGVLHSLSGTMAMNERPVMEATLLAIEDINAQGGLLGRQVEAIIVDSESNSATFAREAKYLIVDQKVSALFGCWTSSSRKTVKPIVEKYHSLLFYPVQYEGLEQSDYIAYLGAVPNQQIFPAVDWSLKHLGSRVYLVGSDYIFPRMANWLIRQQIQIKHGHVVGERYIPMGHRNMSDVITDIQKLHPDVILNTINGDSNIAFFHALKEAGIQAKDTPVMSFSLGESELLSLGGDAEGDYASWSYFQSIDNPVNADFVGRYHARFGSGKPVSDPMEAAWVAVHLWAEAVRSAQTDDVNAVRRVIKHQSMVAPEGIVSIDHGTRHAWKTGRIVQVDGKHHFRVIWSSKQLIRPIPYPLFISKNKAKSFMDALYQTWGGNWEAPDPLVQGGSHE
ncbi:MAG: urea ABC transporter substrate-binding protein [Mariprofundaceae bacterium]|nr:urea ABC transporter substrate-binding protein [Mariprofundaceae bacterium]